MVQVAKALAPALTRDFPTLSPRALERVVRAMVRSMGCPGGPWDVGVMLTTDAHMRRLNRTHRQKDKPTDILSFPFHEVREATHICTLVQQDTRLTASGCLKRPRDDRCGVLAASRGCARARNGTWATCTSAPRTCSASARAASWTLLRRSRRACLCSWRTGCATCSGGCVVWCGLTGGAPCCCDWLLIVAYRLRYLGQWARVLYSDTTTRLMRTLSACRRPRRSSSTGTSSSWPSRHELPPST